MKKKYCPKCKKEIDCLVYVSYEPNTYTMFINKKGKIDFGLYGELSIEHEQNIYYVCPKCEQKLFNTEKEAVKFLEK